MRPLTIVLLTLTAALCAPAAAGASTVVLAQVEFCVDGIGDCRYMDYKRGFVLRYDGEPSENNEITLGGARPGGGEPGEHDRPDAIELIREGRGDDRLIGGSRPDRLEGNEGADRFRCRGGDDELIGGGGGDDLRGSRDTALTPSLARPA